MGYSNPTGGYNPLLDPDLPADKRVRIFQRWCSSFFAHPYFETIGGDGFVSEVQRTMSGLQVRIGDEDEAHRVATVDGENGDELLAATDLAPILRSENIFFATNPGTLHALWQNTIALKCFGNVDVKVLYGTETIWASIWAAWMMEDDMKKWAAEEGKLRDVRFVAMNGANHFVRLLLSICFL